MAAVLGLAVSVAGAVGCARQPIAPEAFTGDTNPAAASATVTTRAGTTTTRKPPPTTAPPSTEAPGTTVGPGPTGATKVFQVSSDITVDVKVGEGFELHVENDIGNGFTWKADIGGQQVKATGLRTDPPAEEGKPSTLVGVYEATAPGVASVTFSQAKADGTPGKQWKVTVSVA